MSPRKAADPPAPSPTVRTRSARPSSIASSSKQTLDGPIQTETRLSASPRAVPRDIASLTVNETATPKVIGKGKGKAKITPTAGNENGNGAQTPRNKRVLPARLRRAAGGGQDGVRDLEEMIVDWLDRYGTSSFLLFVLTL